MTKPVFLIIILSIAIVQVVPAQPAADPYFAYNTRLNGQDSALLLLDDALGLMAKSPLSKLSISWDSLRTAARRQLADAKESSDAYPVINWCAQQARLDHSFLMPKHNAAVYTKDTSILKRTPSLREVVGRMQAFICADGVGYLEVPRIVTTDPATCVLLADSLQQQIRKLATAGASSWILDLRNNTGGNCWPMIAGLGPLLGEGTCGYFVKPESRSSIRYEAGIAYHNNTEICRVRTAVVLKEEEKKNIVVLIGPNTSSAGEIAALAFKGLANVRFMGEATAGFTTGNKTYEMIDGSVLVLSVCREADRKGKLLEGKLQPDDRIMPVRHQDAALGAAVMWLQSL